MSFLTYSSWTRESLSTFIDRNFKKVNCLPCCPILCCLKNTGPFEVNLIIAATINNIGEKAINANVLPTISITRFMPASNRRLL